MGASRQTDKDLGGKGGLGDGWDAGRESVRSQGGPMAARDLCLVGWRVAPSLRWGSQEKEWVELSWEVGMYRFVCL